jgi:hypothetical protein
MADFLVSAPAKYLHALQQIQCDFPTKITVNHFDEDYVDVVLDEPELLALVATTIAKAS